MNREDSIIQKKHPHNSPDQAALSIDNEALSNEEMQIRREEFDGDPSLYLPMNQLNIQNQANTHSKDLNSDSNEENSKENIENSLFSINKKNKIKQIKSQVNFPPIKTEKKVLKKLERKQQRNNIKIMNLIRMEINHKEVGSITITPNILIPLVIVEVQPRNITSGIDSQYGNRMPDSLGINSSIDINSESTGSIPENNPNDPDQEEMLDSTIHSEVDSLMIENEANNVIRTFQARPPNLAVASPINSDLTITPKMSPLMFGFEEVSNPSLSLSILNQSGIVINTKKIYYEEELPHIKYEQEDD